MKKSLLALNLFAIIATLGLMHFSKFDYQGHVIAIIRELNIGYLNEAKIAKELPNPESGTTLQVIRFVTSRISPIEGEITGYPAIVFFGINSFVLAVSIYREPSKNRA